MRIAILADIHGNSPALDAALADIETVGVDEYWVLGDLVALGPDPVGVLQRLSAIQNIRIIRGNTDRFVVSGERPHPFPKVPGLDEATIKEYTEVTESFAWTQGAVTAAGWFDWLSKLALDFQITLPDGTKCLCVHASPGRDNGHGIQTRSTDAEIRDLLKGCVADLICVGHTHQPIDRIVDRWHILNPGSISNPRPPVLEASYAILEATSSGYKIEHRLAEYDRERIISQVQNINHPGADFIIKHMRGLRE